MTRLIRRVGLVLAAVALLGAISAASAAAASLSGTLVVIHGDDFENGKSTAATYVQTASGRHIRIVADSAHTDSRGERRALRRKLWMLAGKTVRVRGTRRRGKLSVASVSRLRERVARSSIAAGPRKVAVIMINFTNDRSTPFTATNVRNAVFGNSNSSNAFIGEDSSGSNSFVGHVATSGDVFGWYEINETGNNPDGSCVGQSKSSSWATKAQAAAVADGKDLSSYNHFVYVYPAVCGTSFGEAPGNEVWLNNTIASDVITHELVHNLGPWHANRVNCTAATGTRVAFSTTCSASEYNDPFSVMGGPIQYRMDTNYHKTKMEFLPTANTLDVNPAVNPGTYTLKPSGTRLANGTVQMIRIPRSTDAIRDNYYLEYRQPTGVFDTFVATDPVVNGITVRGGPAVSTPEYAAAYENSLVLYDMTPDTNSYYDAPLAVNQWAYDTLGDFTIKTIAVSATEATVQITAGPPAGATSTVSVVNGVLTYSAAAGYRNTPRVTLANGIYSVVDTMALAAGSGCTLQYKGQVNCSATGVSSISASLGDGNDAFENTTATPSSVNAGDGNDVLYGGSGNDSFDGGTGADAMYGGAGSDQANYSLRTTVTTVTIDNVANDGASGEGDNVRTDMENVASGSANDSITGSSAVNYLYGGTGNDTLNGGTGNDNLQGGAGTDTLNGQDGDDILDGQSQADVLNCGNGSDLLGYHNRTNPVTVTLDGLANDGEAGEGDQDVACESVRGGSGNDVLTGDGNANTLVGGSGNDTLVGGLGNDWLDGEAGVDGHSAGGGDDTVRTRDSAADSSIDCGSGTDTATVDLTDPASTGCETVSAA